MIPFTSRRRARLRALALMLPAAVLLATACKQDAAEEGPSHAMVNATTGVAKSEPFRETISAIGTVVPRPGSVALLSAPSATRVANVLAVVGQHVSKGAPLVEFERAPFDARAASAAAALQAAQLAHDRAARLVAQGISARKEEEQAAADLARAKADDVAARREAQLARLESPIDGVVTKMTAVLGASVDASQPVVEVADPAVVDVVVMVTPAEATKLHAGASVTLTSGQGGDPEIIGTSQVREVAGAVDPDSRAIAVRVSGGQMKRPLRIGESVVAEITVAEIAKAVTVPPNALVPEGESFKVFTVDEAGIVHEKAVKIGGRSRTAVRIIEGLQAGQIVVVDGAFGMTDGAKVAGISEEDDEPEPPAKPDASKKADSSKKADKKP